MTSSPVASIAKCYHSTERRIDLIGPQHDNAHARKEDTACYGRRLPEGRPFTIFGKAISHRREHTVTQLAMHPAMGQMQNLSCICPARLRLTDFYRGI